MNPGDRIAIIHARVRMRKTGKTVRFLIIGFRIQTIPPPPQGYLKQDKSRRPKEVIYPENEYLGKPLMDNPGVIWSRIGLKIPWREFTAL